MTLPEDNTPADPVQRKADVLNAIARRVNNIDRALTETTQRTYSGPLSATSDARPAAASLAAGSMLYDTTLNLPLWSDGKYWRDATGEYR